MIKQVESSELMLLQSTFADMRRIFTDAGNAGWADFCRAQERTLIKENRVSIEQLGYAGQAARRAREIQEKMK